MTTEGPSATIALLMISNFGTADGGRETWAHNFIPRLLARWPGARLDLIGLHRAGEPDNRPRLLAIEPGRLGVTFLHSDRKRYPVLSMLREAPGKLSRARHAVPDLVIGVGSAVELLVIQASPALRGSRRIVWLRTILVDEKARRLPKWAAGLLRRIEVPLLKTADLLVANGEDTAAYYRQRGLEVTVIANGVDLDRWRSEAVAVGRPLRVAFIGRLTAEKGAGDFLELARRAGSGGDYAFHMVGDGPFADEARAAQKSCRVQLHGAVPNDELARRLPGFDVCVALTYKSAAGGGGGVSNALLEQMAAGRVILAWDNAIFRQLLDEKNAYLVPQGDVAAMAGALKAMLANPDQARAKAAAAQKTAELYSFDSHIEKFVAAAEPLLARGT